jgi:hypothetical protein
MKNAQIAHLPIPARLKACHAAFFISGRDARVFCNRCNLPTLHREFGKNQAKNQ